MVTARDAHASKNKDDLNHQDDLKNKDPLINGDDPKIKEDIHKLNSIFYKTT